MKQLIQSEYQGKAGQERYADLTQSTTYFNAVAPAYFRRYEERSPGGYALRVRKQRVMELLGKRGGKVLDVGCGPGVMAQDLIDLGLEYWGVDASSKMVEECHKNLGHLTQARFSVGDATCLDYPDGVFDTAICLGVIGCISDYESAIREMLRVLKPGGELLITLPNRYSPWALWRIAVFYPLVSLLRPLYFSLIGRPQPPVLYSGLIRNFRVPVLKTFAKLNSERDVKELVERYACEVTDVVYYDFNVLLSPLDEILPRFAMWVAERLERCHSGRLRWLGTGFILKARKTP
jgi:ubiquinone/menaquinone biosynthesis C-methylase UbiE